MLPLTILTLNVRGMASADKRDSVFRFLRTHPAHVVCLQEVHAPLTAIFGQFSGVARPLKIISRPFSFLPPLVALHSMSPTGDAS